MVGYVECCGGLCVVGTPEVGRESVRKVGDLGELETLVGRGEFQIGILARGFPSSGNGNQTAVLSLTGFNLRCMWSKEEGIILNTNSSRSDKSYIASHSHTRSLSRRSARRWFRSRNRRGRRRSRRRLLL